MQISLKTKADLEFILHFVDDKQATAAEWLKRIGKGRFVTSCVGDAEEGYPVFLLDLPTLFRKRDRDITNEFVLLVYVPLFRGP